MEYDEDKVGVMGYGMVGYMGGLRMQSGDNQ